RTGAGISQDAAATITAGGLSIFAGDTVALNEANDIDTLAATLTAGDFSFTDADDLAVGGVGLHTGINTAAGDVTVVAGLNLVVTEDILTTGGNIDLSNLANASGNYAGIHVDGATLDVGTGAGTIALDGTG